MQILWNEFIWNEYILYSFHQFSRGSMQFGVFCMVLWYVILKGKDKKWMKFLLGHTLFVLAFCFLPPMAFFLAHFIDKESYWRIFWLLPFTIMISYLFVQGEASVTKKRFKGLFVLGLLVTLFFTGTLIYQSPDIVIAENAYQIPRQTIQVANAINLDAEENDIISKKVLFPNEMLSTVRQYDASLYPLFNLRQARGFDLISERGQKIFNMVRENRYDWAEFSRLMKEEACTYFVTWNETSGLGALGHGYHQVAQAGGYIIFRTDNFEIYPTVYSGSSNPPAIGVDFGPVYDYEFFIGNDDAVREMHGLDAEAALNYFVDYGIDAGIQGSVEFNVEYYRTNYPDLAQQFGNDMGRYYYHYLNTGREEGRIAYRLSSDRDGQEDEAMEYTRLQVPWF